MPDRMPPSEYGGRVQRNTIQPPISPSGMKGHSPDAAEKLRLQYMTGQDEDSTVDHDNGEAFSGILPLDEALEAMPQPALFKETNG